MKIPDQKVSDKDEIVKYAKEYLKENSLIDMNGFIHSEMKYPDAPTSFIRDVAYQMWGIGIYDFADTYKKDEYLLIKKQSWIARNPVKWAVFITALSAIMAFAGGWLSKKDHSQLQFLKDTQQDSLIQSLKQSAEDSAKHK